MCTVSDVFGELCVSMDDVAEPLWGVIFLLLNLKYVGLRDLRNLDYPLPPAH